MFYNMILNRKKPLKGKP